MPTASIIIPAYNAEKYIAQTLDSILSQSYIDFECIIIDDGSTDKTLEVVGTYNDARIKIISQPNSGGPAKPRNVGIAAAKGEYIFIFDSDDIMLPDKLKAYIQLFEAYNKIDIIFSDFEVIDEFGKNVKNNFLDEYTSFRKFLKIVDNKIYEFHMDGFIKEIIKANFIGTSSIAFKKSLVNDSMLFDNSLLNGDDKVAWVRLSQFAQFYFVDIPFHQYRLRKESISNNNAERLLLNKIAALEKIEKLSLNNQEINEIKIKKNEYFFSLGYFYHANGDYSSARNFYWKMDIKKNFFKVIKAAIKSFFFIGRKK